MNQDTDQAALERWRRIVQERDAAGLRAMLAAEVVFRSPYLDRPYAGRTAAAIVLAAAGAVFQDFVYLRELIAGQNWALEFSARVGSQPLKGIDLIRLDDAGLIAEIEVFIRPYSALRLLGVALARQMSATAVG